MMTPTAKYFNIDGNEDEQALLELSPRVQMESGSRQSHYTGNQRESSWDARCIMNMIYLFVISMIAIGFMIRYVPDPERGQHHHHHHGDHEGGTHIHSHEDDEHHHTVFTKAAVAAGQLECSFVGKDILKAGGNAVDAAIATTLCQGVVEPYFSGIGGGAIMTIYNATTKSVTCISSREIAPAAASREMFSSEGENNRGPTFIAVPGELRGLEHAYKKYGGKVKWADLFEPSIKKAREGFHISGSMEAKLQELYDDYISKNHKDSFFCDLYCNDDKTGVKKEGDIVKNLPLADTLEKVQKDGADAFFKGEIAQNMIKEIQEYGGIMTERDLSDFTVQEFPAIEVNLPNAGYMIHAPPLPLGGPVFGGILSIMDLFNVTPSVYEKNPTLQWHRVVEAFRHTYGVRYHMGDPDKVPSALDIVEKITSGLFANSVKPKIIDTKTFHDPKYYGAVFYSPGKTSTSHVSVLDQNKNAVSVTSTINYHFGARVISPTTGVVFNNEMGDFSYPNGEADHDAHLSPANQIEPGKRPLSSMSPVILTNKDGDPVFIIGAAGGIHIPTAVAQVILRLLYFGTDDFDEPIKAKRLHDHLVPDQLLYEEGYDSNIVEGLRTIGHKVEVMSPASHVNGIKYHTSHIHAFSDLRNEGAGVSGF